MSSTSKLRRVACLTAAVVALPAGTALAMPAPETQLPASDSSSGWALSERASEPVRPTAPSPSVSPTRVSVDDDGVSWPSVVLGAGIAALMALGAAGAVAGMRRRHRPAAF